MKELEKFLERELNGLALKKADWGHLTIEDDSRERALIEVQELVKKLPIHNVRQQRELLIAYEKTVGAMGINEVEKEVDKYLKDKGN